MPSVGMTWWDEMSLVREASRTGSAGKCACGRVALLPFVVLCQVVHGLQFKPGTWVTGCEGLGAWNEHRVGYRLCGVFAVKESDQFEGKFDCRAGPATCDAIAVGDHA